MLWHSSHWHDTSIPSLTMAGMIWDGACNASNANVICKQCHFICRKLNVWTILRLCRVNRGKKRTILRLCLVWTRLNFPFSDLEAHRKLAIPLQPQLSFDLCPATSYPYSLTFHPLALESLLVNQLSPGTIIQNVSNSESVIWVKYNQVQIQVFK